MTTPPPAPVDVDRLLILWRSIIGWLLILVAILVCCFAPVRPNGVTLIAVISAAVGIMLAAKD